jgi:hypothetical protein
MAPDQGEGVKATMVESVRTYTLIRPIGSRPYIESEEVLAADEFEVTKALLAGKLAVPEAALRPKFAECWTDRALLAAPEGSVEAEAYRAWRSGDDSGFDEETALLEQMARAEAEEMEEVQGEGR